MKVTVFAVAAACLLVSGTAFASEELATKNNCIMCHKVAEKGVGPSMTDIAGKYKDDAEGAAKIEKAIKEGSQKAWGENSMMAPQAAVSADDAKAITTWILSLAAAPAGEAK